MTITTASIIFMAMTELLPDLPETRSDPDRGQLRSFYSVYGWVSLPADIGSIPLTTGVVIYRFSDYEIRIPLQVFVSDNPTLPES